MSTTTAATYPPVKWVANPIARYDHGGQTSDIVETVSMPSTPNSAAGRISFAPDTNFNRKLRSCVSNRARTTTMNIRPVKSSGKSSLTRFRVPPATVPSLKFMSVTKEDFIDSKYATEYSTASGIPLWICSSKSNVLLGERFSNSLRRSSRDSSVSGRVESFENVYEYRTVDATLLMNQRLTKDMIRRGKLMTARKSSGGGRITSEITHAFPPGHRIPYFKPLIGGLYHHARSHPQNHSWKSLQCNREAEQKCRSQHGRFLEKARVDAYEPNLAVDRNATQRPKTTKVSFEQKSKCLSPDPYNKVQSHEGSLSES